jgi:hypothetical protein
MALINTTLAAACTATDKQITVASATSLLPGLLVLIDGEYMNITKAYTVGSVTVPVLRAQEGTTQIAHPSAAKVTAYGLPSDFTAVGQALDVTSPLAGRGRYSSSVTTSAAWLPLPGNQDELVYINGTSVVALTIVSPTVDQNGKVVIFAGNGIAAHTITYTTTGFGNVGTTADVITFGTTQMQTFVMIACGGFWLILGGLSTATANVSGPAVA